MTRTVFFESWRGRYADSPRAVSEKLGVLRPEVVRRWVAEPGVAFPADVRTVRRHTPAYFARLLSADVVVANDVISKHLVKGPGVRYVQTWHGTPLKLIGLDERAHTYDGARAHLRRMRRDVGHWDALVSPSPACTELFRSGFGYDGPVWETGYPRNDLLHAEEAPAIRERVRRSLGLEDGALAVLWAPTWRDDRPEDSGAAFLSSMIDPATFAAGTPEGTVLVTRMHKNVSLPQDAARSASVVDASAFPDITELMLACDVLVSDYSSAIVDFASTGKPILLLAPDLDAYCDSRGLYVDYESWAPGPVLTSTEELAHALSTLPAVSSAHAARYAQFRQEFCPWEDGHAGDRVVARLISTFGL